MGRIVIILAAAAIVAGCTSEGDLQLRWTEELGSPAGVEDITTLSCSEPLPGTNEACQLSLAVEQDIDREQVADVVATYVRTAEDVYGSDAVDTAIGTLHLEANRSRRYVFDPTTDAGEPGDRRSRPDGAAVDLWLDTFDDGRFSRVTIDDRGGERGSSAVIDLPANDSDETMAFAEQVAQELDEVATASLRADVPGDPASGITALTVTVEGARAPSREWAFVETVVVREPEALLRVDIAAERVHLVVLGTGDPSDPAVAARLQDLRARIVALAPDGVQVTVGSSEDG